MHPNRYGHFLLRKQEIKNLMKHFKHDKEIYFVLENLSYARNVAAIFRTADALQVKKIYLVGSTPKPPFGKDLTKVSRHKEKSVPWEHIENTGKVVQHLKRVNIKPILLELTNLAVPFYSFEFPSRFALIVGNEEHGISKNTLKKVFDAVFVPMYGKGASLNVHISLAIVGFYSVIS